MLFYCSNFCIVICFKSRKMEMSWWSISTDGTQYWIQTFRWGGGGGEWRSSRPRENGGRGLQKVFFQFFPTLGPQFGLKIRGWGGPPLDLPGTFLAIDPTPTIFHVCKWSSLELVIWTQILQLNLYCLDLLFAGLAGLFSGKISLAIYNFALCPCGWGW